MNSTFIKVFFFEKNKPSRRIQSRTEVREQVKGVLTSVHAVCYVIQNLRTKDTGRDGLHPLGPIPPKGIPSAIKDREKEGKKVSKKDIY